MTEQMSFESRLLDNPLDWTTRLIYADWLDEQGLKDEAFLQRWLGRYEKYPARRTSPGARKPWAWWPTYLLREQTSAYCLPAPVFFGLRNVKSTHRARLYQALPEALDDLSFSLKNLALILKV